MVWRVGCVFLLGGCVGDRYEHNVPVLDRPRLRICMEFCQCCRGMTGYGLGRVTSLPLMLRFMMDVLRGCVIDRGSFVKPLETLIDNSNRQNLALK